MLRVLAASVVALLIAGCAAETQKTPRTAQEPAGPVIVRLVGQHQTITITSSPAGPLYSAHTRDGRTIVANATLDELRTECPEVYGFVAPTVAVDASVESSPVLSAMLSTRD